MPTGPEVEVLDHLEQEIYTELRFRKNVLFLARVTCRGARELIYRVHKPELADKALRKIISANSQPREWEYRMEQDLDWDLAAPELTLLEHDVRFN